MEMRNGYMQTDIGIIPNEWKVSNIIENSTLKARIGWQGLTTAEYLVNGNYLLVTGTDFNEGEISWDTCHYVSKLRYDQDKNIQISDDDILVTKDGTIGKVAFIKNLPSPATLNSGVFVIRPKNGSYVPQYLFYVFNSIYFRDFLRKLVAGSTINHLYQKDFISFNFPLPPTKQEQTAIAKVLSDTDELIFSLEKLIEKKKLIKQGTMQQLLTGKKRLPGFSGEWEIRKLKDIVEISKGRGLSKSKLNSDGKNKCILYGELFTTYSRVINRVVSSTDSVEGLLSENGDVLMPGSTTTKGIDLAIASALLLSNVYIGGDVNILRKKSKVYNPEFLAHYLTEVMKNTIAELTQGITIIHLYGRDLLDLKIELPTIKEQNHIIQIINNMDSEIESLEQKLNKQKLIKQGMMQNLLTGKIRLV